MELSRCGVLGIVWHYVAVSATSLVSVGKTHVLHTEHSYPGTYTIRGVKHFQLEEFFFLGGGEKRGQSSNGVIPWCQNWQKHKLLCTQRISNNPKSLVAPLHGDSMTFLQPPSMPPRWRGEGKSTVLRRKGKEGRERNWGNFASLALGDILPKI